MREILRGSGVDLAQIELEITGSSLMQSLPDLSERLEQAPPRWAQLALDDFGTGYSSRYLKRPPISRLAKIDLLRGRCAGQRRGRGHHLAPPCSWPTTWGWTWWPRVWSIEDQRDFLLSHGCGRLQGFLIAWVP